MKSTTLPQQNEADENTAVSWPQVSLLILNWNGKPLLEQHLSSFFDLEYSAYQVVVVDNGSTDGSVPFVQTQFPQARLICHKQNMGFSPGLNAAMQQIDSDIIVLLNNDVSVRPDWLRALVRPIATDPTIGITGCKMLYPDGNTLQHAGASLSYPLAHSQHDFYREPDEGQADEMRDVPYVTGAAIAIARSVINKIGLLDEAFSPIYYEEADYCYRAREAGFRVVYAPDAVAIHHESFTMRQMGGWHLFTLHKNRYRFVMRHYTSEQILDDFVPAELAEIQEPMPAIKLYALRRALLATKLLLPVILRERDESDKMPQYEAALDMLRENTLSQRPQLSTAPPQTVIETALAEKQTLEEPAFTSNTPIVGSLVAAFRQFWNDISTKWYVRGIIQQQMAFNKLVTRLIGEQDRQGEALAQEISLLTDALLAMQQRVEELETALAAEKMGAGKEKE